MSANQYKYVSYRRKGYWPIVAGALRAVAYLGVPASLATGNVFTSITILTSFYLIALVGLIAALLGTKMPSGLVALGYFLLAWYVVFLLFEFLHDGPSSYPLFGTNYLVNYFVLLALPFFAFGLRTLKADVNMFEYAMMATILIALVVVLYQFLWLHDPRPKGFNSNPIPFGLIMLMWSLFLLARALAPLKIDPWRLAFALVGIIPIVLSGSKLVWICAVLGYASLVVWWAWSGKHWRGLAYVGLGSIPAFWLLYQFEFVHSRVTLFFIDAWAIFAGDTSGPSVGLRVAAAASGLAAFVDHPFLGYGLAQVKAAALEHRAGGTGDIAILSHLHNDYVTHLVAFGILGLVFVLAVFAALFAAAARVGDAGVRRFAVIGGAMFMVYMAGEVVYRDGELFGLLFFLFGLVLLAAERDEFRWNFGRAKPGSATP